MWHDPAPRENPWKRFLQREGFYHHGVPFPLTCYKDEIVSQTSQNCSAETQPHTGWGWRWVQNFRSDGEGEETLGLGEHNPLRATGVLLLSRKLGQGLAEQG